MNKNEKNTDIFSNIVNYTIPKWSELPEIDLYMDQVIALMEKYLTDILMQDSKLITPSMINNYVKLGIIPPPIKKKYSREHLAYLFIICSLKQVMPISDIKLMIEKKLQKNTISETLNFYSDLYAFTFNTLINICSDYQLPNTSQINSLEDASLFTAIAAANCRNISSKILYMNNAKKDEKN